MFATLKNAAPGFEGTDLAINTDTVISVYQVQDQNDETKFTTFLYTNSGQTFQVQESVYDIAAKFNGQT